MTYDQAREAMKKGHGVRRALWDTYVQLDEVGRSRWVFPARLKDEFPDTVYVPTPIDAEADDWEIAVNAAVKARAA